ncbi:MAG: hypothetical protein ABIV63_14475 [Caldimonas sp.]
MRRLLLILVLSGPLYAMAGSIYLCKTYSGGTFWSSAHCGQHNALIDRIVSVPDSLPWDQQVQLGEQDRAQRAAAVANTNSTVTTTVHSAQSADSSKTSECAALSAQAARFDAMARQPQTGQMQDWIKAQKRMVTDRQYQIRC